MALTCGDALSQQEIMAIKEALCEINYDKVANDEEQTQAWLDDDTITINTCRNGSNAVWIVTESDEVAVYIDTLNTLSPEEIKEQLM